MLRRRSYNVNGLMVWFGLVTALLIIQVTPLRIPISLEWGLMALLMLTYARLYTRGSESEVAPLGKKALIIVTAVIAVVLCQVSRTFGVEMAVGLALLVPVSSWLFRRRLSWCAVGVSLVILLPALAMLGMDLVAGKGLAAE